MICFSSRLSGTSVIPTTPVLAYLMFLQFQSNRFTNNLGRDLIVAFTEEHAVATHKGGTSHLFLPSPPSVQTPPAPTTAPDRRVAAGRPWPWSPTDAGENVSRTRPLSKNRSESFFFVCVGFKSKELFTWLSHLLNLRESVLLGQVRSDGRRRFGLYQSLDPPPCETNMQQLQRNSMEFL